MAGRLSPREIATALETVPLWRLDGNAILRDWTLPDFAAAFALVGRIALVAEALDHHPDIAFGWGRVAVSVATHDAGGLTALDIELAKRIDAVAG
ncbi:4a-hydroxytetrahydrobiopterin dehydratase [Acetobacteraceae bacterium KSS8]|uniref:Putative pterin-4-alpha-carbinolamine dehydratase n=1 Tax=Endosaccharibacter trunci TaxID=2812733 RepID=A0ABT1W6I1_9PROT|nr:4a-hydroxytetrahydrobiopterin dehydratase [Acetobacteraceae bacterium KSS8]